MTWRLLWDNEAGIGRGKRHADGVGEFAGTLATTVQRLRPYDPESKGLVERRNGFFETSFMPGRAFASPADLDAQLTGWLTIANARTVRTVKARPVDLVAADKAAMLPLPPVAQRPGGGSTGSGWDATTSARRLLRLLPRKRGDPHVDPTVIGRVVDVAADLSRVEVRLDGRLVAAHDRSRARGRTITDPAHVAAARVLREQYQSPRPAADPHGDPGDPGDHGDHEELGRDLAEYDRAFGLLDALTEGEVA